MFERLFALETFGIKLGLSNISAVCARLGHPERTFRSAHIAGTNGKGSVTAMVHAGLVAAGIRTGRYTSPHLSDLSERFVVDGSPVGVPELQAAADTVLDTADALVQEGTLKAPPTFFEATTAIAFEIFRRRRVDVAVIEVGLGGRFDATNVIEPLVGAITSIGIDHQAQLGSTLESIAFEKAGIIKSGVPVVTGRLPAAAAATIAHIARERQAVLIQAESAVRAAVRLDNRRALVRLATDTHDYDEVRLALPGEHQVMNALVAVCVMEELSRRGVAIPASAIVAGLRDAAWPGRLETVRLHGGRELLMDAAHNPEGAAALSRHLLRWYPVRPTLVFGAMRDKDIAGMLEPLLPVVGSVIVTAPSYARAEDPQKLADAVRRLDSRRDVRLVADPVRAVEDALATADTVCVAGSIFLIGQVREAILQRAILP